MQISKSASALWDTSKAPSNITNQKLKKAILHFLLRLNDYAEELAKLLTEKFQIIEGNECTSAEVMAPFCSLLCIFSLLGGNKERGFWTSRQPGCISMIRIWK